MTSYSTRLWLALILISCQLVSRSAACTSYADETKVLLDAYPSVVAPSLAKAQVKIEEIGPLGFLRAKVIRPVSGFRRDENFWIFTGVSSCDRDMKGAKIGDVYFIAGKVLRRHGKLPLFEGAWKGSRVYLDRLRRYDIQADTVPN